MKNTVQDREFDKFRPADNDKSKVAVTVDQDSEALRFDQASPTLMYLGVSPYGALETEAKWKIQQIDTSSGVSIKNASQFSDQVWSDRLVLTYV